jgi:hypothetical protein
MHCHPERNEVESKDPVEVTLRLPQRDPATSLGMTEVRGEICYGSES